MKEMRRGTTAEGALEGPASQGDQQGNQPTRQGNRGGFAEGQDEQERRGEEAEMWIMVASSVPLTFAKKEKDSSRKRRDDPGFQDIRSGNAGMKVAWALIPIVEAGVTFPVATWRRSPPRVPCCPSIPSKPEVGIYVDDTECVFRWDFNQ